MAINRLPFPCFFEYCEQLSYGCICYCSDLFSHNLTISRFSTCTEIMSYDLVKLWPHGQVNFWAVSYGLPPPCGFWHGLDTHCGFILHACIGMTYFYIRTRSQLNVPLLQLSCLQSSSIRVGRLCLLSIFSFFLKNSIGLRLHHIHVN